MALYFPVFLESMMILFCACAYSDVIPASRKVAAFQRLQAAHPEVQVVADLCGLAARRDPLLKAAAGAESLCVAACHPRAVRALFAWANVPLDPARVHFINLREDLSDEALPPCPEGDKPLPELPRVDRTSDWIPWFPVIDRARCRACRQCLEFCLFGVYETREDGGVSVVRPEACKTNCPACARLCPDAAIMFPKYNEPPIDGSEITDETAVRAASKALAEGDLRAALEERRKKRRALLKPEYRPDDGDLPT
jgi:Pyruvate/2-oxoacid:ferredoxin oxidoreductase delta subunit